MNAHLGIPVGLLGRTQQAHHLAGRLALRNDLLHRLHQDRVLKLARDAQADRQVQRADKDRIQPRRFQDFVQIFITGLGLDLDHHQPVVIGLLDELGLIGRQHDGAAARPALPHWRELRPLHQLFHLRHALHGGHHHRVHPHIQRPGHQVVILIGHPHDRVDPEQPGAVRQRLHLFVAQAAVLGIHNYKVIRVFGQQIHQPWPGQLGDENTIGWLFFEALLECFHGFLLVISLYAGHFLTSFTTQAATGPGSASFVYLTSKCHPLTPSV